MEAKVSDVLKHKGDRVVTVMPQESVAAAVQLLTKNRIGAAPVVDEQGRIVGIISERDIIRGMSEHAGALLALSVDELMTRDVKTCLPQDRVVDLMHIMTFPAHSTLAGSP